MEPGIREVKQVEWCCIGDEMDTEVTFELYSTGEARVRITDHEAHNRPEARDVAVLKTDVHELRYVRDNLNRIIGRLEKCDFSDRRDGASPTGYRDAWNREVGKNPCPICGGRLSVSRSEDGKQYTVTCAACHAFATDDNAHAAYQEFVSEVRNRPRYIEIDETRVKVRSCAACPCFHANNCPEIGDFCMHPRGNIDLDGVRTTIGVAPRCPLREVE